MNTIKSFEEFVAEELEKEAIVNTNEEEDAEQEASETPAEEEEEANENLMFNISVNESTGEVSVVINENYVKDLQVFMRDVVEIANKEKNIKAAKLDKWLDANMTGLVTAFKAKKSAEDAMANL